MFFQIFISWKSLIVHENHGMKIIKITLKALSFLDVNLMKKMPFLIMKWDTILHVFAIRPCFFKFSFRENH